jgi:hypothetical protein
MGSAKSDLRRLILIATRWADAFSASRRVGKPLLTVSGDEPSLVEMDGRIQRFPSIAGVLARGERASRRVSTLDSNLTRVANGLTIM